MRENRMKPILKFEQVSKDYPNGVHALKGVSFEVREGEFISVIGPSGSGKSTLLRAINRLIPISGGTVWLDGQPVVLCMGDQQKTSYPGTVGYHVAAAPKHPRPPFYGRQTGRYLYLCLSVNRGAAHLDGSGNSIG